jgi:hypothetical protein
MHKHVCVVCVVVQSLTQLLDVFFGGLNYFVLIMKDLIHGKHGPRSHWISKFLLSL